MEKTLIYVHKRKKDSMVVVENILGICGATKALIASGKILKLGINNECLQFANRHSATPK